MAVPGTLETPRQVRTVYIYSRESHGVSDKDYILNDESTGLQSEDHLDGVLQATLDTYTDEDFWTVGGNVLTYNPITDNYDIKPGEYVL